MKCQLNYVVNSIENYFKLNIFIVTFPFMHLADAFIQSDLHGTEDLINLQFMHWLGIIIIVDIKFISSC